MTEHSVVIAGGGPTGLMLAGELRVAGVDVVVVERRRTQELVGSRARGIHSRTIEVLDQRGIADRFLAEGQATQIGAFAGVRLDISDFPRRHNYGLSLGQNHVERNLAGWVGEFEVPIMRECEVTGFAQDEVGVDVELADGRRLRARFLVGCDGGRSVVRRPPASSSRVGILRSARCSPRWRCVRSRSWACGMTRTAPRPWAASRTVAPASCVEDVFATEDAPPAGWMRAIFDGGPYHDDVGRCVPGPPAPTTLTVSDGAGAGVHLLPAYSRLDRCTAAPMRSN
jgi:hypothetical protein